MLSETTKEKMGNWNIWSVPCKKVSWGMQIAKTQISLHICTGWSGPLLFINTIIGHCRTYQWRANWPDDSLRMSGMNLDLCILRTLEDTFALCTTHVIHIVYWLSSINPTTKIVLTVENTGLSHCSLETPKRVIGKQCRSRSDTVERGIWLGSPLFANSLAVFL